LGDIILKVDSKAVQGRFDTIQEIAKRRPGQVLTLTVWRNKKPVQLKVTVTPRLPR
jgi:serine protease Do